MRPSFLTTYLTNGLRPYAFASVAPLLVACSAGVATPGTADSIDAADGAASAALVVVQRTVTAGETTHGSAVARFVRVRTGSVDDETLRMVGATLDLPALGTCAATNELSNQLSNHALARGAADSAPVDVAPRAVELLDVGGLAVEANGVRTSLEARALPDIVDLVTGVLYSTRTTTLDPDRLPARTGYVLRSTGSAAATDADHSVPAFAVAATAPGEPDELRIDGQDARDADGVSLTAGARVDLSWSVGSASDTGNPDDVVYVELVADSRPGQPGEGVEAGETAANVRCLFADRGVASIPATAFVVGQTVVGESSGEGALGEVRSVEMTHGTIIVHRVHREAFSVEGATPGVGGIDSGVIRFDFARAAEFTRH
jgi:hypothetical protein